MCLKLFSRYDKIVFVECLSLYFLALCVCVVRMCVCAYLHVCVCVCLLQKEDGMSVEDRVAFALTYLPDIQVRNILTKGLAHL